MLYNVQLSRLFRSPFGIIIAGVLFGLISPPLNSDLHWSLTLVPFLSIPLLLPFFVIAGDGSLKRRIGRLLLWGTSANIGRIWWLTMVTIPGKWIYIVIAMIVLSLFLALWYLVSGLLLHKLKVSFPRLWIVLFPSAWVILDYIKCSGELSFPWMYQGYLFTPLLPLAQLSSVTGVWGITWLAIFASALLWARFVDKSPTIIAERILFGIVTVTLVIGFIRLSSPIKNRDFRVALVQQNIDQINWDKEHSLDNAQAITGDLIRSVKDSSVDWILLSESGVYAYLDHNWKRKVEVMGWVAGAGVPIALGTLDYTEKMAPDTGYNVYNTSFLLRPDSVNFEKYNKMKLVPVSEGMPYGWKFPILSRIKIPGGGFQRGFEEVLWKLNGVTAAPTICYEAIYPGFNRDRVNKGADCIVNMTNDSWFGISSGPYQHAAMARMRAIECGVPMIRCTASGISYVTDGLGRIVKETKLGTRDVIVANVPVRESTTLYLKFGDWFVGVSTLMIIIAVIVKKRRKISA